METPPEPSRLAPSAAEVDARAKAAREAMGTSWVAHPAAARNPRHSAYPEQYGPARQAFLQSIRDAAAAARASNPKALKHATQ